MSTGDWPHAREEHLGAIREFVRGHAKPFQALWARDDRVSIFGGWGAYEQGWSAVEARLAWAASRYSDGEVEIENLASWVDQGVACTVDIEHQTARLDAKPDRVPITLRSTHVYSCGTDGWRCVHRHADFMPPAAASSP
jgi:ketosteroid isomerase-like protein